MKILINLDDIIDTRIGVVKMLYNDIDKPLMNIDYHNRLTDNFFGVEPKLFNHFYSKRGNDVVTNFPHPTPMLKFLVDYIIDKKIELGKVNGDVSLEVILNVYPYTFNKEVLTKLARNFKVNLLPTTMIRIISKEKIDKKFILDTGINTYICYYGVNWINDILKLDMLSESLSHVTLIVPAITEAIVTNDKDEIFKYLMASLLPHINLEFVSPGIFSSILVKKKEV